MHHFSVRHFCIFITCFAICPDVMSEATIAIGDLKCNFSWIRYTLSWLSLIRCGRFSVDAGQVSPIHCLLSVLVDTLICLSMVGTQPALFCI